MTTTSETVVSARTPMNQATMRARRLLGTHRSRSTREASDEDRATFDFVPRASARLVVVSVVVSVIVPSALAASVVVVVVVVIVLSSSSSSSSPPPAGGPAGAAGAAGAGAAPVVVGSGVPGVPGAVGVAGVVGVCGVFGCGRFGGGSSSWFRVSVVGAAGACDAASSGAAPDPPLEPVPVTGADEGACTATRGAAGLILGERDAGQVRVRRRSASRWRAACPLAS